MTMWCVCGSICLLNALLLVDGQTMIPSKGCQGDATSTTSISCPSRCCTQSYTMRVLPGQELKSEVERFARERGIDDAAYVATGIGTFTNLTIHYSFNPATGLETVETFCENLELCSMSGTISPQGSHLHVVVGRIDGSTIGGHLITGIVQYTAEVVLGSSPCERYQQRYDPAVGSDQLVVSQK